jgi:flagellar biosynthesis/type III secretory pathway protein FliH
VTRVLKAVDVLGVREDADERRNTELAAEQARQDQLAAAYAAGYDDGLAAARSAGAEAGPRGAAALERLVAIAAGQHTAAVDVSSRAVLAAAMDIAEWVLRHELASNSRSVVERLRAAAQAMLPSNTSRVTVSPHDEVAVRAWAQHNNVEVIVSADLAAGDAHFDTGVGHVEVTVAAALRIAAEALGVDPAKVPA